MTQYILSGLIAALSSLILFILGLILNRLAKIDENLNGKVDKEFCEHQQELCEREYNRRDLWDVLNRHSHTGLEPDSKVVRG